MRLASSYAALPERFFEKIRPTPVSSPRLLLWNGRLAAELGVPEELAQDRERVARVFSGNEVLPDSEPIAMAYAGHQFGHFVSQLGDGRAHLLGEIVVPGRSRWDVQLKGSGPTRFSRRGDGRCALGPAIREFIMSEAMHGLGVPTTRCLAVVATGEAVVREIRVPGAIVTRVAASHVRVGTFEYFAARRDQDALARLVDYAVERHYPEIANESHRALALLEAVIGRQIELIVHWMRVGFIHGVMNTDNCAISGETIDYGPCAMMGVFDPKTVYSSIDSRGRYAYGNQPFIAGWNMARLAETLLPLMDPNERVAVEMVTPLLNGFSSRMTEAWLQMMGRKLGLTSQSDEVLVTSLLERMEQKRLDYTITFDRLGASLTSDAIAAELSRDLEDWYDRWRARIDDPEGAHALMRQHNPVLIPRNHHVEAALAAAVDEGDLAPAERLLDVLRTPYEPRPDTAHYRDPPPDGDAGYRTFCGT